MICCINLLVIYTITDKEIKVDAANKIFFRCGLLERNSPHDERYCQYEWDEKEGVGAYTVV